MMPSHGSFKTKLAPFRAQLAAKRRDDQLLEKIQTSSINSRATRHARCYDIEHEDEHEGDPSFDTWSANRAIDVRDFDYLLRHRQRLNPRLRQFLEIILAKITHFSDGKPGYFNKLEQNVGYKGHITPIAWAETQYTDKIVRCGLWANAKNSRRCHKPDFCSLCLWVDQLQVWHEAFSETSGAFSKALAWHFVTIGFTTTRPNSGGAATDGTSPHLRQADGCIPYDPYPVALGGGSAGIDAWIGYDDARALGLVAQEAIGGFYKQGLFDGYKHKLEGAFCIHPGHPNRMNIHSHSVVNGSETNTEFLADALYQAVDLGIVKHHEFLHKDYFPNIHVVKIPSAADLRRCFDYTEKVISFKSIVDEALERTEARLPNGDWDKAYVAQLHTKLCELVGEDIPSIFTAFRMHAHLHNLQRRKSAGNMRFGDRGTCIGWEPSWHVKWRRKKSLDNKERRARKRADAEEEQRQMTGEVRGQAGANSAAGGTGAAAVPPCIQKIIEKADQSFLNSPQLYSVPLKKCCS